MSKRQRKYVLTFDNNGQTDTEEFLEEDLAQFLDQTIGVVKARTLFRDGVLQLNDSQALTLKKSL